MNPVVRFALLACGITWVALLPLVLQGMGIVSFGIPEYWHGVAPLGPLAAAWVMRRSADPGFRFRDLYRKQEAGGVGAWWTVALVLTPVAFVGVALAAAAPLGYSPVEPRLAQRVANPAWLADLLIVSVLYGFGEEAGWRGWLLPHLQRRHNALRSTVFVALIWALWHLPFLVAGGALPGTASLIGFFLWILAGSLWLTFVFNSTGGSVLAAALWHMLWNAAWVIVQPAGAAAVGRVPGMLLVVTAFGIALVYGRRNLSAVRSTAPQ